MNIHRLAIVLFLLMTGTLAYAVTSLSILSNFNVVTPANIVSSPTSLSFGNIEQGTSKSLDFTLTNSGGTAAILTCTINDSAPADGVSLSLNVCNGLTIQPAGTLTVTATLTASPAATIGAGTITISITA